MSDEREEGSWKPLEENYSSICSPSFEVKCIGSQQFTFGACDSVEGAILQAALKALRSADGMSRPRERSGARPVASSSMELQRQGAFERIPLKSPLHWTETRPAPEHEASIITLDGFLG